MKKGAQNRSLCHANSTIKLNSTNIYIWRKSFSSYEKEKIDGTDGQVIWSQSKTSIAFSQEKWIQISFVKNWNPNCCRVGDTLTIMVAVKPCTQVWFKLNILIALINTTLLMCLVPTGFLMLRNFEFNPPTHRNICTNEPFHPNSYQRA